MGYRINPNYVANLEKLVNTLQTIVNELAKAEWCTDDGWSGGYVVDSDLVGRAIKESTDAQNWIAEHSKSE